MADPMLSKIDGFLTDTEDFVGEDPSYLNDAADIYGMDEMVRMIRWLRDQVEQARKERDAVVRQLEDALLIVWGELPAEQTLLLRDEVPRLMDFIAHLHHSIEHEQAMVRRNVWAESPAHVDAIRQARATTEADHD